VLTSPDLLPIGVTLKIPPRSAAPAPPADSGSAPAVGVGVLGAPQLVPVDGGR
jgi:hypothetical protein